MKNNKLAMVPPEKIPFQYSVIGKLVKAFLHTKVGAKVGFMIGLGGFNKIVALHYHFQRLYQGGKIKRGEYIRQIENTAKFGVFTLTLIPSWNSRVNKGGDLSASLISGTSFNSISTPLPPKFMALSTSSLTPAKTDTTLTGETAATGLARVSGTIGGYTGPASLDGACSFTITNTFTNSSGGSVTLQSAALFDAVSSGNMFVEANLSSSVTLANGDQLVLTWTINL